MVSETVQEPESTGLTVGVEKTHWTGIPPMEEVLSASGRSAGNLGRGRGLCRIHGGPGRKRENRCHAAHSGKRVFQKKREVCFESALVPNLETSVFLQATV